MSVCRPVTRLKEEQTSAVRPLPIPTDQGRPSPARVLREVPTASPVSRSPATHASNLVKGISLDDAGPRTAWAAATKARCSAGIGTCRSSATASTKRSPAANPRCLRTADTLLWRSS
eukprot:Hpha_TRINITY_DN22599_c0_g1::TRINITY_DN22599_c0_g1_i1::g.185032::m.185032